VYIDAELLWRGGATRVVQVALAVATDLRSCIAPNVHRVQIVLDHLPANRLRFADVHELMVNRPNFLQKT
jgi:hypothetical protein